MQLYRTWAPNTSIIQAFSSLFFLSYAKLDYIMWQPYKCTTVWNTKDQLMSRLVYIDPTVAFMSKKHICIVLFSLFVGIFLYFTPLFLLILYPTSLYRKVSHKIIKAKWRITIKTYVETFQGCYKDGTDGTLDYRAICGYQLVVVPFVLALQIVSSSVLPAAFIAVISIALFYRFHFLCSLLQLYKSRIANVSAVALLAIMTTLFALHHSLEAPRGSDIIRE